MATPTDEIKGLVRVEPGEALPSSAFNALIRVPVDVRASLVTMHVLSDEKVEQLISAGSAWPLAMFTLVAGIAAALLITIYSGSVLPATASTFWVAFWGMLILTLAFGGWAFIESAKTRRIKQAIKEQSKTVVNLPTVEVHSQSPLK